uniref:Uncharacterized protein n=1 Tax=Arundo donax TaxID=35708 RepID=A0A0A9BM28_ARUDO
MPRHQCAPISDTGRRTSVPTSLWHLQIMTPLVDG